MVKMLMTYTIHVCFNNSTKKQRNESETETKLLATEVYLRNIKHTE